MHWYRNQRNRAKIEFGLEFLAIVLGLAAAVFWWCASVDSTPDTVKILMQKQGGMDILAVISQT